MQKRSILTKFSVLFWALWSFVLSSTGCEGLKNYHDSLIETSLISEIPTLIGNMGGNALGAPFLLLTCPSGYLIYPEGDFENAEAHKAYHEARTDWIASPLYVGSYSVGILLGSPFYPLALLFPRDLPEKQKEDSTPR